MDHPESTVEEPHSAGIAPALEHEIAPDLRATPPSSAASSGAASKSLRQIEPRKYSAVEARIFLPMVVGCSTSCHSDKAWEVKYKHKLGPPPGSRTITWSTASLPCHVALAHVLKWAWECHEAKTGEACIWDLDAFAEGISVRDWILTRCVNFCRCEWTAKRESSLAEAGCVSKYGWEMKKKRCVYGFSLFSQELCQRAT